MNINTPVNAMLFTESKGIEDNTLAAYGDFVRYRLKSDALRYRNASFFVPNGREREFLLTLSDEKLADIEAFNVFCPSTLISDPEMWRFEFPSYAQYILDVDCNLISDIQDAYRFSSNTESKTLELFEHTEKSIDQNDIKTIIGEAVRLQRVSIVRLDLKIKADSLQDIKTVSDAVNPVIETP